MRSALETASLLLGAVIPAAGRSRRMGTEKILLPFGGSTMLENILETLALAGIAASSTFVVLRPDRDAAAQAVRRRGVSVLRNPDPDAAPISSVRIGLTAARPGLDAIFIWPADHPAVSPETIRSLALRADPARACIPLWNGRRGHPALLGRDLFEDARAQSESGGLRQLWRSREDAVFEWPVDDPGVVANADTPEQYEKARELWDGRRL